MATYVLEPCLSSYLVLVLRPGGVVLLQRGELAALGAGLGTRVQLTQLQEVSILCHVIIG